MDTLGVQNKGQKFVEVSQNVAPFTVSSRLSLNPVDLWDSGVYTCKAANMFGSGVASNYVHVTGSFLCY